MSIPTDQLQKLKRSLYWLCLANLGAAILYMGLGWLLHSNALVPELNRAAPFLWAVVVGFGAIGVVYSLVFFALLLQRISEAEQLLRSGKLRQTRLARIAAYPLGNLVFGLLAPSDRSDSTAKTATSANEEVLFFGLASDVQSFKFNYRTFADPKNSPALEVTAHSDEHGKLRLLTCDDQSLIQVAFILPATFASLMSALYSAK